MEYRTLGRTGLRVSEIGFGAMTIGGEVFGPTDDQESLRALHRALDLGLNFIDTADAYGRGASERLIAPVLKERRHDVVLATKGGNEFTVRQGQRNFDPDYITSALEQSLGRLQIDTIDLYQLHNPPPEVMLRGEIFERLDLFKREGKIRFYGVSLERTEDGVTAIETGRLAMEVVRLRKEHRKSLLSQRQIQILVLVANGIDYSEVAASVFVSKTTVSREMRTIFERLGVRDAAHAVNEAHKKALI